RYSDATTDDSRLVMRVIQEGKLAGGTALNYVKVEGLEKDAQGRVTHVQLTRADDGKACQLAARVVVNATGAWADHLMGLEGDAKKIRPLRGSHLVLKAEKLKLKTAL